MSSEVMRDKVRNIMLGLKAKPNTKAGVQTLLLAQRAELARNLPLRVRKQEMRAISLLRRPKYPMVDPTLQRVAKADYALWDYLRVCLSSAPWTGRPGRLLRYFVLDKNSGGILGVVDLGSEVMMLTARDKYIGWSNTCKLAGGGLRRVVNMGTCVAAQPFGWLCGGKYIAEAVATKETADTWGLRYGDALAMASTTSLYGKSSQYNRLPNWRYLGLSAGASPHALLSADDRRVLRDYLRSMGVSSRQGAYSTDYGGILDVFDTARTLAGISLKDLPRGHPRGVYVSELYHGAVNDLRNQTTTGAPERRASDISGWWKGRWCDMRWEKMKDRINTFSWHVYRLDYVMRARSIDSDAVPLQGKEGGASPARALHTGSPVSSRPMQ